MNLDASVRRLRHGDELPYKRIGICCGKRCPEKMRDTMLYRVTEHEFRYRCRTCFKRERRYWP